jgi:hypothetical protein
MPISSRKKTLLAKIESVYGTDSIPTGSANAMLVKNLTITPIQAELVSRDLIKPYFGNSEQLLAQTYVTVEFETEYVGSGVIGKAPAFEDLLRACALGKTVTSSVLTATVASSVASFTLAAHGYQTGDKILTSGSAASGLNGEKTITRIDANTFTVPAAGVANGSYADVTLNRAVVYAPISSAIPSATLYYNVDGVFHKVTGSRGTVELGLNVKQIPTFKFNFTGIYNAPSDVAAPSVDYSTFKIPQIVNTQNTAGFSLFGYSGNMESMSLNIANEVNYRTLVGYESVDILDRKPAGTVVFEAPTITAKDFFSLVRASTTGAMTMSHGSVNGFKVDLAMPSVLLGNPSYTSSDNVEMLSAPFTAVPVSGNDELTITFR